MFALGCFAFLLAFVASAALTPVSSSSAQVLQYDVNEETGYYIQVTGSDALTVSDIRPTVDGALSSIKDTLNVETNSPFGFRLVLSAESADMYNTLDTNHTASHFSPVSGDIDNPAVLALDTWGFALNQSDAVTSAYSTNFSPNSAYNPNGTTVNPDVPATSSTWAAVPTTPTEIAKLETYNHATGGSDLDIYYGLNASTNLLAGTYTNTITYTAYSEGANLGLPTMQDFTIDQCNAMLENSSTRLLDTRDQKVYRITKYADGNCWMSQNLALDGTDAATGQPRTLTSADTNLDATEIPSGEITFPAGIDITDDDSEYDIPQIYTLDQNKTTTTCQYDFCVPSDEPYGNYYNWNAATAMQGKKETINVTIIRSSVCPKGWRLPDNGTESGAKTYSNLVGKYTVNIDGTGDQMPTTNTGKENVAAVKRVQQAPFYFPLAGRYASGIGHQGAYGFYWSRKVYNALSDNAYQLSFNVVNNFFYPQGNNIKSAARSVRCVLGE